MNKNKAIEQAIRNRERTLADFKEVLRVPSISTFKNNVENINKAAEWFRQKLISIGFINCELISTTGFPVVYGEYTVSQAGALTILIYGHYDVQPPEPLDLWNTLPFDPSVRNNCLYARGASDMKGQIMASIAAIEAILQTSKLPVNIKYLIEGEEEIGSPSMVDFLTNNADLLKADFALNLDSGMFSVDIPGITYALRGLAYFEIHVTGPKHDLHSGSYGGIIHNPANALCEILAGMHDQDGKITLPGFYDSVLEVTDEERKELSRLPVTENTFKDQTGVRNLWGESSYTPVERIGARPTLDINGIISGYTGVGGKTIIPAKASAKISMRLVPDQNPKEVHSQLVEYLKTNAPETIDWDIIPLSGGSPSISNHKTKVTQAFFNALEETWQTQPVFKREGGSIPIVGLMQDILGIDSVLSGFNLPGDNAHAPDEHIHLPTLYKGIEALICFFDNLDNKEGETE